MKNLQEQVRKTFCYQKLFWPFTVQTNCSSDLEMFGDVCKDPVLHTLIKGHRTKTWWQVGLAQVSAPHTFQKSIKMVGQNKCYLLTLFII